MGMAATLIYGRQPFVHIFNSPFNTRLHIKFEEIWPSGFRGEVIQRCEQMDRQMDGWMDGRTDGQWTENDHNSSS